MLRNIPRLRSVVVSACALAATPVLAQAVGTAFTYQGRLTDGRPRAALRFRFILMDAEAGGSQEGPIVFVTTRR
jgi:hypothetical protein